MNGDAARPGNVVIVGDVMTDVIVVPDGPIVHGSDRAAAIRSMPGGSGANQAVWLAALGVPTGLVARVGATDLRTYEAWFRGLNVVPFLEGDRERPTGVLVTIVDADGERSFFTDRGANLGLGGEGFAEDVLADASTLLISGYALFAPGPRRAVRQLIDRALAAGMEVAVDPGSAGFLAEVGPSAFLDWIEGASLVFANRDEARLLTGADVPREQLERLARRFGRVALKLGAEGGMLCDDGGVVQLPAQRVEVRDSSGAGDAFAAGYLAARAAGADVEQRLRRAIEAGTLAIGRIGAQPDAELRGLLSRQALDQVEL